MRCASILISRPISTPSLTSPSSRSGPTTSTLTLRSVGDSRRRVTSTSSSRSSTLVPIPLTASHQAGPPLVQPPRQGACVVLLQHRREVFPVELHREEPCHRGCPRVRPHRVTDSNCYVPISNLGTPMYATELSTEAYTEEAPVSSRPSSLSSTVRTASRSRRVSTSTRSRRTTITPAAPLPVCTRTPSRSSPRSTSPPALATSPASITRRLPSRWLPVRATSMHMFATNYNVLRIQSGMGGLAFSN